MGCRRSLAIVIAGLLSLPAISGACDVCNADRMARVYDHAMVTAAHARRHPVIYLSFGVPGRAGPDAARVRQVLTGMPAVNRESVRLDASGAVAAFSFDPRRTPLETMLPTLSRRLRARGIRCDTLQVDHR